MCAKMRMNVRGREEERETDRERERQGERDRQTERDRQRERETGREGRALQMLLIRSIFVVAYIIFFFYSFFFILRTVYVFCIRYKIDIISSKAYKSVVRMTQVFDLEKCSISKTLLQVFKRENDLIF